MNPPAPTSPEYPDLHDALRRCPPAAYRAACAFRATGAREHLAPLLAGVLACYTDRDRRALLEAGPAAENLRLREDLGLDSLTMMEVAMLAEEILPVTFANEDLARLRSVGDVRTFVEAKLCQAAEPSLAFFAPPAPAVPVAAHPDPVPLPPPEAPAANVYPFPDRTPGRPLAS